MPLIRRFSSWRRHRRSLAPRSRGVLRGRALTTAALATVAGALAAPSLASAGQYEVFLCQTPSGRDVPLPYLSFDTGKMSFVGADNTCGSPGGVVGLWLGDSPRDAGNAVRAHFRSPVGGVIAAAEVTRQVFMSGPSFWGDTASPVWRQYKDQPALTDENVLESCVWGFGCSGIGRSTASFTFAKPATNLVFEVACGGSAGAGCAPPAPGGSRAVGIISGLHLTINEHTPPSASIKGAAVQTGTVHRGVESLTVDASDITPGVREVWVTLGGTEVARAFTGGACADQGNTPATELDYVALSPCPTSRRFDLDIDTRRVPDGRHSLRTYVRDGAGNVFAVPEALVDTDNVPAPKALKMPVISGSAPLGDLRPGDTLNVSDGVWEGEAIRFTYQWQRSGEGGFSDVPNARQPRYEATEDDIAHQLRVVVTASNREGTTSVFSNATDLVRSGATVKPQSLAPTSEKVEGSPQLVVDREQRSVQVARGAKIVVTGRLVDADAQPIADAEVDVFEQVSVVGAPWRRIASVRTDGQGGYAYRPGTAGSRTLRFAYAARRESGDYRATREVVISVMADMRLRAVPRVVRRGGMFRLRGRVGIDPLPATGTWVEVQVLDAGVWRTVGTRRTSATGRWSFRHRVQRVSGVTFTFRARLRPTADVPAAESKSAPVKVRVR